MTKDDGGPAFPFTTPEVADGSSQTFHGMTLRDYFAGQAVTMENVGCYGLPLDDEESAAQHVARSVYNLADAMIAERNKENGK